MGIRSDITMQAVRIACGSLVENKDLMIVLYWRRIESQNNNINLSRQFTQIEQEL